MPEMSVIEAIRNALDTEMGLDERVIVLARTSACMAVSFAPPTAYRKSTARTVSSTLRWPSSLSPASPSAPRRTACGPSPRCSLPTIAYPPLTKS